MKNKKFVFLLLLMILVSAGCSLKKSAPTKTEDLSNSSIPPAMDSASTGAALEGGQQTPPVSPGATSSPQLTASQDYRFTFIQDFKSEQANSENGNTGNNKVSISFKKGDMVSGQYYSIICREENCTPKEFIVINVNGINWPVDKSYLTPNDPSIIPVIKQAEYTVISSTSIPAIGSKPASAIDFTNLSNLGQCAEIATLIKEDPGMASPDYFIDSCYIIVAKNSKNIEACSLIKDYSQKKQCYIYLKNLGSACNSLQNETYKNECISLTARADVSSSSGSFTDARDGQTYKWVKIGTQTWFAENLKFDSGCSKKTWTKRQDVGWCGYYENKIENANRGLLYQWSAAMNNAAQEGSQGSCPDGWHVPSDKEFDDLAIFLGMNPANIHDSLWIASGEVGKKLKDDIWGGTNEYGFSILPVGFRYSDGSFNFASAGQFTSFWTSSDNNSSVGENGEAKSGAAWHRTFSEDNGIYRFADGNSGAISVRCIKD